MAEYKLIGIAGGSGSGKSLIAENIYDSLGPDDAVLIRQASYYKDMEDLPIFDRGKRNFDHPDSFDNELLHMQVKQLLAGKSIELPVYDFTRHVRATNTERIDSKPVIILEGILILNDPDLRQLMHTKVYVDTPSDIRIIRRIKRDLNERNRNLESIFHQYENSVRMMHLQFVEPSKHYADIIVPEGEENVKAIDLLKNSISVGS